MASILLKQYLKFIPQKTNTPDLVKLVLYYANFESRVLSNVGLSVSRAFGDAEWKSETLSKCSGAPRPDWVLSEPFIRKKIEIDPLTTHLILACDGIRSGKAFKSNLNLGIFFDKSGHERPNDIANLITETAFDSGSNDNISVVVVKFEFLYEMVLNLENIYRKVDDEDSEQSPTKKTKMVLDK